MKPAFFILFFILANNITYGQYKVESPAPQCNQPECMEEAMDSTVVPKHTRSLSQAKKPAPRTTTIPQKMYHIESLNALFFVPEAFIPLESSFNIGGAIKYIVKVQIFDLESNELIFQTSTPQNTWNGKWKNEPQYGFFKYVISIHVDKNTIETIEGIVETKSPL